MKHNSPQLGFNNNVRHKGLVFHIQTEDSGVKHPHIITHLFADGGRILKSQKTSYAEFLGEQELSKKVRSLMQEQHKAMFIALRAGKFDHMLGDAPADGPASAAAAPAPGPSSEGLPPASTVGLPPASAVGLPPPPPSSSGATAPPSRGPMPSLVGATEFARSEPPPPLPPTPQAKVASSKAPGDVPAAHADTVAMRAVSDPTASQATPSHAAAPHSSGRPPPARLTPPPPRPPEPSSPARHDVTRAPTNPAMARLERPGTRAPSVPPPAPTAPRPTPAPRPPLSASLDLDLEALERAADQNQGPVYKHIRDLPPPPASLLKPSLPRNTSYRSVTPQATQIVADPKGPPSGASPPGPSRPGASTIPRAPTSSRGSQRYAPSRPASIFGSSRPQEGSSIFGEDLISEKSLDEVILSYLAEDLEPGTKK
ncbi:MAG: hypothetical protein IPG04_30075 [Polyangiaceae bacterium]|nr:hypothetical protein [Polyangiaceae bacterium]